MVSWGLSRESTKALLTSTMGHNDRQPPTKTRTEVKSSDFENKARSNSDSNRGNLNSKNGLSSSPTQGEARHMDQNDQMSILSRLGVVSAHEVPKRLDMIIQDWSIGFQTSTANQDASAAKDRGRTPTRLQTASLSDVAKSSARPSQASRSGHGSLPAVVSAGKSFEEDDMKIDSDNLRQASSLHNSGLLSSATQPLNSSASYNIPIRPASSSQPATMQNSSQRSSKRKKAGFR